jgi:hypothetical protein
VRRHTDSLVFVASRGRYDIVQCTFMDNSVVIGATVYAADHAS